MGGMMTASLRSGVSGSDSFRRDVDSASVRHIDEPTVPGVASALSVLYRAHPEARG